MFCCSYDELCKAWIATRRVSKDDWMEWVRRLSVELLKESPSPALRSCWALANIYNPLARFVTKVPFLPVLAVVCCSAQGCDFFYLSSVHFHAEPPIWVRAPGCVLCPRIDPLRFLAGCSKRRLNQGLVVALGFFFLLLDTACLSVP